jgi:hypothetical protein
MARIEQEERNSIEKGKPFILATNICKWSIEYIGFERKNIIN